MIDLKYLNFLNGDVSIIKILMVIYLVIFANCATRKIQEKCINIIDKNMFVKHIIGLITISILLSMLYNLDNSKLILYTFLIYFVFLLSTKISREIIPIFVTVLTLVYFYNNSVETKLEQIKSDESLNIKQKFDIISKNENTRKNLTISIVVFVIVCSALYDNQKHVQYGGSYSIFKLLD